MPLKVARLELVKSFHLPGVGVVTTIGSTKPGTPGRTVDVEYFEERGEFVVTVDGYPPVHIFREAVCFHIRQPTQKASK